MKLLIFAALHFVALHLVCFLVAELLQNFLVRSHYITHIGIKSSHSLHQIGASWWVGLAL